MKEKQLYEHIIDCEELLKYLYSRTEEQIGVETVLETDKCAVSDTAISKWKTLKTPMDKKRIQKLRDNKVDIADIVKENIYKLRDTIEADNSFPNAKKVFNMLFYKYDDKFQEALKLDITDENADTPLTIYMTKLIGVEEGESLPYLPGRSVTLKMLCDLAKALNYIKKYNYKKSGILSGLKYLVELELVEAFVVEKNADGGYAKRNMFKNEINETNADEMIFKLSIPGCIKYINANV